MASPRDETEEGEIPDHDSSADAGRLLIDETAMDQSAANGLDQPPSSSFQPPVSPVPPKVASVSSDGASESETLAESVRSITGVVAAVGTEENRPPPPKPKSKKKKEDSGAPTPKRKRKAPEKETPTPSISQEVVERRESGSFVRTIAAGTEAELLGLAEPGTPVCLEGCVFHEDAAGFLVINVTWRGKSFVGTLLDSSRHDWAPPRPCESPPAESDSRGGGKSRGGKRGGTGPVRPGKATPLPKNRKASTSTRDIVNASPLTVKTDEEDSNEGPSKAGTSSLLQPLSPVLLSCPCRHCHKQFHHPVALKYHQTAAHPPCPCPPESEPAPINGTASTFQPIKPKFSTPNGKANGELVKLETPERAASASGYSDISDEGTTGASSVPATPSAPLPLPSSLPTPISAPLPLHPTPPKVKREPKSSRESKGKNGCERSPATTPSNPIPVIGAASSPATKTKTEKREEAGTPLAPSGPALMFPETGLFANVAPASSAPANLLPFPPPVSAAYALGLPPGVFGGHHPGRGPAPGLHHSPFPPSPFHTPLPPHSMFMGAGPGSASPLSRK